MNQESHVDYFSRKAREALAEGQKKTLENYRVALENYKVALAHAPHRRKAEIQKLIDEIKDKMKGEK